MTHPATGGRSIQAVLELLKDPEFGADAQRVIAEAAALREHAPRPDEGLRRIEALVQPFLARWGVVPPTTGELLDADPRRRRYVDALASGRWGLVPVFPWTTGQEIRTRVKKIRRVIRKQHQDALLARGAQLVGWLQACGFERPAIARAVFQRRTGLRRPSKAKVFGGTSCDYEQQLHKEYSELGLTERQIEQRIDKRLRGSEARASAAVRMVEKRYVKRIERLNEALATPIRSEPLSHALTMLFRAVADQKDDTVVRGHATAVTLALVGGSGTPSTPRARSGQARIDAIVSKHWGLVPVFPWTTDPEMRAFVKKIRTLTHPPPQRPARLNQPAGEPSLQAESLSDALTRLLPAVSDEDNALVRRQAMAAWAALLRMPLS